MVSVSWAPGRAVAQPAGRSYRSRSASTCGVHLPYDTRSCRHNHDSTQATRLSGEEPEGNRHQMRDIYHDELDEIGQTLEAMTQLVQDAMSGRPGRCSTATSPVPNASFPKTLTSTR